MRLLLPAAALLAIVCNGQAPAFDPGPKPGTKFPAFSLQDQNGKAQSMESLRGPKGLMLLFHRSADW
ncbi:MAG: hypothetical protein JNK48_08145 [Bryobacterales bacterium]|nr:hypothetical protein [Bryobacterales bacterium]